jgi:hypothetical protein
VLECMAFQPVFVRMIPISETGNATTIGYSTSGEATRLPKSGSDVSVLMLVSGMVSGSRLCSNRYSWQTPKLTVGLSGDEYSRSGFECVDEQPCGFLARKTAECGRN